MKSDSYYSINEVEKMTGISKFTLRNWEKRYSFLQVMRKDNGHRVYHKDELTKLIQIKKKMDKGLTLLEALNSDFSLSKTPYKIQELTLLDNQKDSRELYSNSSFEQILELLSSFGTKISRVCLAMRIPHGNELVIIHSEDRLHLNSDKMAPYYRCFVKKASSLFKLTSNQARSYSSIETIKAQYGKRAIQKSINYLSQLGHQSGHAISYTYHGEPLAFLFINSNVANFFDDWSDSQQELLGALQSHLSSFFKSKEYIFDYWKRDVFQKYQNELTGQIFNERSFSLLLNQFLDDKLSGLYSISSYQLKYSFLYVPLPLIIVLSRSLSQYSGFLKAGFKIHISHFFKEGIKLEVKISDEKLPFLWDEVYLREDFQDSIHCALEYGIKAFPKERCLDIFCPIESNYHSEELYSTFKD